MEVLFHPLYNRFEMNEHNFPPVHLDLFFVKRKPDRLEKDFWFYEPLAIPH
jgi:hypothetical protein